MEAIDAQFKTTVTNLIRTYDETLKKSLPESPKMLPIRLNVIFQWRIGMKFENVNVQPFENLDDLLDKHIAPAMEARGDPVIDWNRQKLTFKITGPLEGAEVLGKTLEVTDLKVPFQIYGLV